MASCRAVEAAAAVLFAERDAARGEAASAVAACREIVDSIIAADARALAAEWVAAVRLGWELQDRLTGLARLGGDFLPHGFQAQILAQIDRRRSAIAENALMIERHNFDGYLDRLSANQQKRWLDYGRRLMDDPEAVFDADQVANLQLDTELPQ